MTDPHGIAPLHLFEYDHKPGHFCLMFTDTAMVKVMDVFEAAGFEGGGYSWEGVARAAVATQAPEIADRISYDPEAGMFVAYGTDEAALARLGGLLHAALNDKAALAGLIRTGDLASFD